MSYESEPFVQFLRQPDGLETRLSVKEQNEAVDAHLDLTTDFIRRYTEARANNWGEEQDPLEGRWSGTVSSFYDTMMPPDITLDRWFSDSSMLSIGVEAVTRVNFQTKTVHHPGIRFNVQGPLDEKLWQQHDYMIVHNPMGETGNDRMVIRKDNAHFGYDPLTFGALILEPDADPQAIQEGFMEFKKRMENHHANYLLEVKMKLNNQPVPVAEIEDLRDLIDRIAA